MTFVLAMVTLFLGINIAGISPYVFGVSCHFAYAMRFSFSLWFRMFLFRRVTNGSVFGGSFVLGDLPVVGRMVMV